MDGKKFNDADGQEWTVCISTPDLKRVRKVLGIDLLKLGGEVFKRLLDETELLVDVVSVLLTPDIEKRGLDAEGFARKLRGDALDGATQAVLESLIDFFPKGRREAMRAALQKTRDLLEKTEGHALTLIQSGKLDSLAERAIAEMDQAFEAALTPGSSFTGSRDTPGSTLTG